MGPKSTTCRAVMKRIRLLAQSERRRLRKKYKKKEDFLTRKYSKEQNWEAEFCKVDQLVFMKANIYKLEDGGLRGVQISEPILVNGRDQKIELSQEEKQVLTLNPKFCVYNQIRKEDFEVELEQAIIKERKITKTLPIKK